MSELSNTAGENETAIGSSTGQSTLESKTEENSNPPAATVAEKAIGRECFQWAKQWAGIQLHDGANVVHALSSTTKVTLSYTDADGEHKWELAAPYVLLIELPNSPMTAPGHRVMTRKHGDRAKDRVSAENKPMSEPAPQILDPRLQT